MQNKQKDYITLISVNHSTDNNTNNIKSEENEPFMKNNRMASVKDLTKFFENKSDQKMKINVKYESCKDTTPMV